MERSTLTLKEHVLLVHTFETVERLRLALMEFNGRYHCEGFIEKHGHRTRSAVRDASSIEEAFEA